MMLNTDEFGGLCIPNPEMAVIGSILLNHTVTPKVAEYVTTVEDFDDDRAARAYGIICEISKSGMQPDAVAISDCLVRDGAPDGFWTFLSECTGTVTTSALAEQYAQMVVGNAMLRRAKQAAKRLAVEAGKKTATVEDIAKGAAEIAELAQRRVELEHITPMASMAESVLDMYRAKMKARGVHGLALGMEGLDRLTGGLEPGEIFIVSARTGVGKTAFAVNAAVNVARDQSRRVLFLSCEMSKEQIGSRVVSVIGNLDTNRMFSGAGSPQDDARLGMCVRQASELPLDIVTPPANRLRTVQGLVRRAAMRGNLGLVVLDYIQLLGGDAKASNRNEDVSNVSRGLKMLAVELGVPFLVLAQLNRSAENEPPRLSHLRESGSIEQDADRVLFLIPDEKALPNAPVSKIAAKLAKNRHGQTGMFTLDFHRYSQRMEYAAPYGERNAPPQYSEPQAADYDDLPFD